jgi:DNA-binding Lrp family transcriptional regulator
MQNSTRLDGFDLKILAALQQDGRLTNQELADRVGLSPSQCSRRRSALEDGGVVKGYRADLDPEKLGLGLTVFTHVSLAAHNPDNSRKFADLVSRLEFALEAHALTGDTDYLVKLIVPDLKALSAVINEHLLPHESVANVRTAVVLDTLKTDTRMPLSCVKPSRPDER